MIEMKRHVHHVFFFFFFFPVGNDLISLESRPLIFVYLYTRTQSIRKPIVDRLQYEKVNISRNTRPSTK